MGSDVKVVVVGRDSKFSFHFEGDGIVGKTSFIMRVATREFPGEYIPMVFENYSAECTIRDKTYRFALWDAGGS